MWRYSTCYRCYIKNFYEEHVQSGAKASVLTTFMPDPFGYGRVIRLVDGSVEKS